jgi:hypothetical protein
MRTYRGPATIVGPDATLEVEVDLWARGDTWGGSFAEDAGARLGDGGRVRVVLPTGEAADAEVSIVPAACVAYLVAAS